MARPAIKKTKQYLKERRQRKTEAMRRWRERNVEKDAWNHLLRSAQKRGIRVELTYEEFVKWGQDNNYFQEKGRGKGKASIGRIESHVKVYSLANIFKQEYSENSSDGAHYGHGLRSGDFDNPMFDPNYDGVTF